MALSQFWCICEEAKDSALPTLLESVAAKLGAGPHMDFNLFSEVLGI